jgi:hypothetical protein
MFLKRLREQSHSDRGTAVAKMERDCQDDVAVFASHSGVSETITGLELMRSGPNNRRPRGRGNPGRGNNNRQQRNNNVDSNGPDVKVRGTPQQVVDKYQTLAEENCNDGKCAAAVEQLAPNTNGEAEAEKVDATGDPAEADEATVERIEVVQEPVAEEPEETAPA